MRKVLLFGHVATLGGAGLCLHQLVSEVRKSAKAVVVLSTTGPLVDMLESAGTPVHVDPDIRSLMPNTSSASAWNPMDYAGLLHARRAVRAAEAYCRKEQPDVVHINTSVLMHLAAGARRAGVETVLLHVREHWNVKPWDPRDWVRRNVVGRAVDHVIAISRTASEHFGFTEKTTVIYDWPDFSGRDDACDLDQAFGIAPGKKVLLVLGGRNPLKGTSVAMQAMRHVEDDHAVMLVIGGRGDTSRRKERIRRVLRALRLETYGLKLDRLASESEGRIVMSPAAREIKSIMAQSAVILCPFTTPHFAMPSIEAGQLGRPVIMSDSGYARETVRDGETGIIVLGNDPERLALAFTSLLEHPSAAERMGKAAQAFVSTCFNEEEWAARLANVYAGQEGKREPQ